MDRRHYLSVMATALVAGCGESDTETPAGSATPSDTASPTATPSATETPADTPPGTESDTPPETETPPEETPDDSDGDEQAPEQPDEPNPELESIAADIARALDVYEDAGAGGSLTATRPDVTVAENEVRGPLYEARDTRGTVDRDSLPADEQTRYDQLEGAYWFAWYLPAVHIGLHDAYSGLQNGWDTLLERNWDGAESDWERVSDATDEAETALERLTDRSEPSDMAGFDRLDSDDYTAKLDQFEALLDNSTALDGAMLSIAEGFQLYERGGENDYLDAERAFDGAADDLRDIDVEPDYRILVEDALCVADAMAAGCELLDRAQQSDDEERKETLREDAQEEFDECDIVDSDINIEVTE